jgi:hypothetical protein
MGATFGREALLDAFDQIGRAAVLAERSCRSRFTTVPR